MKLTFYCSFKLRDICFKQKILQLVLCYISNVERNNLMET